MGLSFDEHTTAGMLYSNNNVFYCVWFVIALFMIDESLFTIQKYHVNVTLSVLINVRTQVMMLVNGEWACILEQCQNTPKHKSRLLILLQNMLTLAHV